MVMAHPRCTESTYSRSAAYPASANSPGDPALNSELVIIRSGIGLTGVREPDAVTAACVLVEAALFRDLGGFSEDYIIGDFEDSDLCLRARARGRVNRVALDTELYHLERQSQNRLGDALWRTNLTIYNCWLHNRRWSGSMGRHP